jgi:hypothetical protein
MSRRVSAPIKLGKSYREVVAVDSLGPDELLAILTAPIPPEAKALDYLMPFAEPGPRGGRSSQ